MSQFQRLATKRCIKTQKPAGAGSYVCFVVEAYNKRLTRVSYHNEPPKSSLNLFLTFFLVKYSLLMNISIYFSLEGKVTKVQDAEKYILKFIQFWLRK